MSSREFRKYQIRCPADFAYEKFLEALHRIYVEVVRSEPSIRALDATSQGGGVRIAARIDEAGPERSELSIEVASAFHGVLGENPDYREMILGEYDELITVFAEQLEFWTPVRIE